jgi:hypothetical protein
MPKQQYQFTAAGPMLLRNPAQAELQRLRMLASQPNAKIRYLILRLLPTTSTKNKQQSRDYQVFAYASQKQTSTAWRRILGSRMEHIAPPAKSILHSIRTCQCYLFDEATQTYSLPHHQLLPAHYQAETYGSPSREIRLKLQQIALDDHITLTPTISNSIQPEEPKLPSPTKTTQDRDQKPAFTQARAIQTAYTLAMQDLRQLARLY